MKAGLPSVCSIVSQEEDSKPRQTSIRNFFGARTHTTTQKTLPTKNRTSSTKEDRESSANGRTDGPVHDAERDVEVASLSHPSIRTLAHPRRIENITSKSADEYRIRKRRRTTAPQQQQLYLDFGQRNFCQTILCSTCGMLMVHGVAADVRRHESICRNYLEGIPWNDSAALKPCWEGTLLTKRREKTFDREEAVRMDLTNRSRMLRDHKGSAADRAYIIEIRPTDRARCAKKMELLHSIVDQELGFVSDAHATKRFTTYLCIVNKRVVGMVLVEEISSAYRLLAPPSSTSSPMLPFGLTRSAQSTKAVLGIYQLWVHRQHRHRGIASVLVDVARKQMVFGCTPVPVPQVAFSSPTESGLAFAQYYYSVNCEPRPLHSSSGDNAAAAHGVLVYDCG